LYLDYAMNTFRISVLFILLVMVAGCTHPLNREDKKLLSKMAKVTATMAFAGIGAGGGTVGMDESVGGGGAVAIGAGAAIALRQSVVLNLDKREEELRQSESVKQGYMIVERFTPYQLRLSTAHQAAFANGSALLTPQIHVALNDITATMKRHKDAKIMITGHADDGGTIAADRQLAERRVRAARRYMEQHGVEAWRIEHSCEEHAIDTTNEKKNAYAHRRLDIIITSLLLDLRADLDLQERNIRQFQSSKDNDLMVKRSGPGTLKLAMAHRAAFSPGSTELPPQGDAAMNDPARLLKRHPYANVEIIGHANDSNSPERNRQLSEQRAQAIANYMKQGGMDALRVRSRGAGQTVYNVEGKHAQDAYRRVEIILSNKPLNLVKYVDRQEEEAVLFQSAIHEDLIVRRPTLNKLNLILAHQAAFAAESVKLPPRAHMALKEVVTMLKRYRQSVIHVIGHAGEKNSSAEDRTLSELRARVVAGLLKQQGIATARVDSKGVGRKLYAPINKGETDTFRRVEIVIEARHGI